MKNIITLLTSAAVLAGGAVDANASNWWYTCIGGAKAKWASNGLTLRASSVGFPTGSSWATALASVASAWSATPSNMNYSIQFNEPGVALNNGQNETWWTDSLGAPAVCYLWYTEFGCQLVETDVLFLNTVSYSTSTTKSALTAYGGGGRPFRTTALHEFGHAQGLAHTGDTYSIMGQDWDHIHANGATATAYPGEDAVAGSMGVYGKVGSAFEDLAVAHWRFTGASGEYSSHARTRLFDSVGVEISKYASSPEPVYLVKKGQIVKLEMSYENLGKSSKSVKVGYYLSTNDIISTADQFLGEGSVTIGPDVVFTTSNTTLVIPTSVNGDQNYWLGAIIDYNGAVAEADEGNNATYTGIRIAKDPPDLQATSISGPSSAIVGQSVTINRNVASVGGTYAGSFAYSVRLSPNSTISSIDVLVLSSSSSSMGSVSQSVAIPASLTPGTYYWGLMVEPVGGETNTSNNAVAGGTITVNPKPDLKAVSIVGPTVAVGGNVVKVKFDVAATAYTGSFLYELRVSLDPTITSADPLVASGKSAVFGPRKAKFVMPSLPAGKYYWGLIVVPVANEASTADNAVAGGKVKVKP